MGVTIEKFVVIASSSIVLPGVTIKEGALVAAHSSVSKDVEAQTVVAGSPAKYLFDVSKLILKDGSNEAAYPWRRHFQRGYPQEIVQKWRDEFSVNEVLLANKNQ
jgi:carbonic anhydrase/acetyltransferase-like protein (isoleucine patch superfamily)